jgi:multimeric flavodoxin WrbA
MKIAVLNGSPKGATSVTMQYVYYVQKVFPQHELEIVHVAQRIRKFERDGAAWQALVEQVRASDGVLWAFPLYILHVHAHYKRFIELIWERDAQDAFADKYAAALSTSIHYFDNTAHDYVHAICDDLDMKYVDFFSPEMRDLLGEEGQAQLTLFAQGFFDALERQAPTSKIHATITWQEVPYVPGPTNSGVPVNGQKVLVLTDALPHQANLQAMTERFAAAFSGPTEMINLHDLDIKGSCLGCLRCGYDNQCAYQGKDDYVDFYNSKVREADILVFAGAISDRYLSSTWKTFFDRSFFNTHTPTLRGKQFAFIISGPLSQNPNLRQILEAWSELQQANVAGFVTDEFGPPARIDDLLQNLAGNLARYAQTGYVRPHTFLGVGGMKVFRDDIWGRLRTVFQADHRAYRRLGVYDFPQRDWGIRALNLATSLLFKIPRVREEFARRIKTQMVQPYRHVLLKAEQGAAAAGSPGTSPQRPAALPGPPDAWPETTSA